MKKTKTTLLCASAIAFAIAFASGCNRESKQSEPSLTQSDVTVSFDRQTAEIKVDETLKLGASVSEKLGGKDYGLTYTSSDLGVLSVAADGTAKGLKIGQSTVTASLSYQTFDASATCVVTVKGLTPAVDLENVYDAIYSDGMTLNDVADLDEGYSWKEDGDTELHAGDGQKFTVVYTPSNAEKYETVEIEVTVNVEKAAQAIAVNTQTVSENAYTLYYTGAVTDFSALNLFTFDAGKTPVYKLTDADERETDITEPIEEGTYTLTATLAETADYKAASASLTFVVELTPKTIFLRDMAALPVDVSAVTEDKKTEIIANYAKLTDGEKSETNADWNMTLAEKYAEFFENYVQSADKGDADNYYTYFHTAYGPSQVTLSYTKTPAEGVSASAEYDSSRGFADEAATLKVLSDPDWTQGIYLKITLNSLSYEDASGADAVFCYVYNDSDDLMMLGNWPTLTPLPARQWTLLALPKSTFGVKGLPAATAFGSLELNVYYYNETADRERLDNGVNLNFTSWTAATPAYINSLIAKLDSATPDKELVEKICGGYQLLSAENKALVTGFAAVETLYKANILGDTVFDDNVVVNFEGAAGAKQVRSAIQTQAFSAFYPRLVAAPGETETENVTCWENRVGSLTSYYKFDMKIESSLLSDFSEYNVLTFGVYFESPRNQFYETKGDGKYYLEVGGKKYVYETDTWYTVRVELPASVVGTTLTFYAWNATQDRAACFMSDKIYLTDIKAENFDFASDFEGKVNALTAQSTKAEIDAVREAYKNLPAAVKTEDKVKTAYDKFWNDYYVTPALAELNRKISALAADATADEIKTVVAYYNSLEAALQSNDSIKEIYDEFYAARYATLFAAEFKAEVDKLNADSSDEELIAALAKYREADAAVKENQTVEDSYGTLCNLIEARLNADAWVDYSGELARAYNLADKVVNPDASQTVTYETAAGYADETNAAKITVSANWNAASEYQLLPQVQNGNGKTVVCFYVRSTDTQYRKVRVIKAKDMNGTWKTPAGDYARLEKETWTFVSFELDANEFFYINAMWWKDNNGAEKYNIGYEMKLEISSIFTADAAYVSKLIAALETITDADKKAEYVRKIKDIYNVLSEAQKAEVVGYGAFIDTYFAPAILEELNGKISQITAQSGVAEIQAIVDYYNALDGDLKANARILAAYQAFYTAYYPSIFAAEFKTDIDKLTALSADEDLIAALAKYRAADAAVKENQTVAASYGTLCELIETKLNKTAFCDIASGELARAYYLKYKVENPVENQDVTYETVTGYADETNAAKITVSENWNANSVCDLLPQVQNTSGGKITVCFYVRSTDPWYRKIRVIKAKDMNGTWKAAAGDYVYLEKEAWTFVSFELDADEFFYIYTQWWKDNNGNGKYLIGYEMQLEFTSFFTADAAYVSDLIVGANSVTDTAKKAEYVKKIKDIYGVLSETQKAEVVGYDEFAAANS